MAQTIDILPTINNKEDDGRGSFRVDKSSAQGSYVPSGFFPASGDAAKSDSEEVADRRAFHYKMVRTIGMLPTINKEESDGRDSFRVDNSLSLGSYFHSGSFLAAGDAAGSNGEEGRGTWLAGSVARNLLALRRPGSSLPPPRNPRERVGAAVVSRPPRVRNTPGTSQPPVLRRLRRRRVGTWEIWLDELEAQATSTIQAEANVSSSDDEDEELADAGASSSHHAQICKSCDFDEQALYEAP